MEKGTGMGYSQSGLSDREFQHVFQTCASVRFNHYPPYVVKLLFIEILSKTSPELAASVKRLDRAQFDLLLQRIKKQLFVFQLEPETVVVKRPEGAVSSEAAR
jgi:hypothetical protein